MTALLVGDEDSSGYQLRKVLARRGRCDPGPASQFTCRSETSVEQSQAEGRAGAVRKQLGGGCDRRFANLTAHNRNYRPSTDWSTQGNSELDNRLIAGAALHRLERASTGSINLTLGTGAARWRRHSATIRGRPPPDVSPLDCVHLCPSGLGVHDVRDDILPKPQATCRCGRLFAALGWECPLSEQRRECSALRIMLNPMAL